MVKIATFAKPETDIPQFSRKSRTAIIESGELDWSAINPDIFGSMIQAVITPEHSGKPIEVLLNASKVLQGCKKEKEVKIDLLPTLAPLIDKRCNYNTMIEYLTIWKLKG